MERKYVRLAGVGGAAIAVGLIGLVAVRAGRAPEVNVTTVAVTTGSINRTVMTTGTFTSAKVVDVGVQVSGTVQSLDADFNSHVRAGQVIARLDPATFDADLMQATAVVDQAVAEVARLQTLAADARTREARAETLATAEVTPQADLDAARIATRQALSDLKAGQARIAAARAGLARSRANRAHTVIRSPIDGVVVNRAVEVGQTVNAAMSAPVLFTIADLRQMLLLADVHEGEVAGVTAGVPVTFTIDSDPDRRYQGSVDQVRLQPLLAQNAAATAAGTAAAPVGTSGSAASASATPSGSAAQSTPAAAPTPSTSSGTVQPPGVVSYTAVVEVDNREGAFSPGGTAVMTFGGARRASAVRIPNNAMSFRPAPDLLAALGQREPPTADEAPGDTRPGQMARVWMFRDGRFEAIAVRVGLADDTWTELLDGPLKPGDQLVTQAAAR